MSSDAPLPTIDQMLTAFGASMRARDGSADVRMGSNRNVMAGIGAILWARECQRDQDLFRSCYFDGASGDVLEDRIVQHGGASRVQATRGQGKAVVRRASATAGGGRFWAGTRIGVHSGSSAPPRYYRVAADTDIAADVLSATIPIEADELGTGFAMDTAPKAPMVVLWEDTPWDNTWTIESLVCADGTDKQSDRDYLAAYRQAKIDRRSGYARAITDACKAAGAAWVALFASDYISPDTGLNRVFVADASFSTPAALLRKCTLALESARVLGCDLTVGGMTRQLAEFDLTITLANNPGHYNQALIINEVRHAIVRYLSDDARAYVFRWSAVLGEIARAVPDMTAITVNLAPNDTVTATMLASPSVVRLYSNMDVIRVALEGPA